DQDELTLQLQSTGNSGVISPTDPRYGLVYYRDQGSNVLVTGLYQKGSSGQYTAIGPYDASGNAGSLTANYLVSTDTSTQNLYSVINDTGTYTPDTGTSPGTFLVQASKSTPTVIGTTAVGGISVVGCPAGSNGVCVLGAPTDTAPALYQAGDVASDA